MGQPMDKNEAGQLQAIGRATYATAV